MAFQRSWSRKRMVLIAVFAMVSISFNACQNRQSNTPVSQEVGSKPDAALVKKLYETRCAICHGFDGKQRYAGAKDISVTTMNKVEIIERISEGKGSMPPQKEVLTHEQIDALADFVVLLQAQ